MNLQNLMKQAQSMQKKLLDGKKKIEEKNYVGTSELVEITMNGKKEMVSVKIKEDTSLEKDDLEILQDMIVLATNDAIRKINKDIESTMGSEAGAFSSFM